MSSNEDERVWSFVFMILDLLLLLDISFVLSLVCYQQVATQMQLIPIPESLFNSLVAYLVIYAGSLSVIVIPLGIGALLDTTKGGKEVESERQGDGV